MNVEQKMHVFEPIAVGELLAAIRGADMSIGDGREGEMAALWNVYIKARDALCALLAEWPCTVTGAAIFRSKFSVGAGEPAPVVSDGSKNGADQ